MGEKQQMLFLVPRMSLRKSCVLMMIVLLYNPLQITAREINIDDQLQVRSNLCFYIDFSCYHYNLFTKFQQFFE